ncbi:glycosyltransferase family 52 [Aeromonas hydrophila]|uniref:glycosyltransferase family 52 n=1 Tax=Aeromonas hydrophila TaxID=644 RepID=UPI001F4C21CC|nr:glycosyltransferase family 52 [Aeromonas hydrophila]UNB59913.1 glycosyltransferase family 52 protein [Aeromonas hydrophila]
MELFICTTPLQVMICISIIKKKRLTKDNVELLYFDSRKSPIIKNTLKKIEKSVNLTTYIETKNRNFFYFHKLFFYVRKRKINSIYLASIDLTLIDFILSYAKYDQFFTFDDGTANILPNSFYYKMSEFGSIKRLLRSFFGLKYNLSEIKSNSQRHYSIYSDFENIIDRVEYVELAIDDYISHEIDKIKSCECNVILGSCYEILWPDITETEQADLARKCKNKVFKDNVNTFYIPHPGNSKNKFFNDLDVVDVTDIAEIEIVKLLNKFEIVNVYGFVSSCQFNIRTVSSIKNHVFYSDHMPESYKLFFRKKLIPPEFEIISID